MHPQGSSSFLDVVLNLARFHREHEKFYAESPLHDAITLQRCSHALQALAERWAAATVPGESLSSPFAGAADLNDDRATETLGILFMEGQGEPAEITRLKVDLAALAGAYRVTGQWLASAMEAAWLAAETLVDHPGIADLLAERHRIISNDWQSASSAALVARSIDRGLTILARVTFTPSELRADLAAERLAPRYLFSASEMFDHAADLAARSATLTHDNERRWRVFHQRIEQILASSGSAPPGA